MRLTDEVYLVGSGFLGLHLTDEYDCNIYLLDGGSELALVDSGAGHRPTLLLDRIREAGFDPAKIAHVVLTHKHADHSGGAGALSEFAGARVWASAETAAAVADATALNHRLQRARRSGAYPADYSFQAVEVTDVVAARDSIRIGALELEVLETPGHCAGHLAFVLRASAGTALFSGDALLPGGQVVLQPIPDCSVTESVASIELLDSVRADLLLPGHLAPVIRGGGRHVAIALERIRSGRLPEQLAVPAR